MHNRSQDELVKIKVMIDWEMPPVWLTTTADPIAIPVETEDLLEYARIPTSLITSIDTWHAEWLALLNWEDPASTRFPSPEAETEWEQRGLALARRLADYFEAHIRIEYLALSERHVLSPGLTSR